MRILTKSINPVTFFWIEDYSEEEKEFFLQLGFVEKKFKMFMPPDLKALIFKGSGPYDSWTKKELYNILDQVLKRFGDNLKIEKFSPE